VRPLSGPDVVLFQGELEGPVPTLVYPPGHLLLICAVTASHLRRLGVPGPIRQALKDEQGRARRRPQKPLRMTIIGRLVEFLIWLDVDRTRAA
jgi:hypothetical protein